MKIKIEKMGVSCVVQCITKPLPVVEQQIHNAEKICWISFDELAKIVDAFGMNLPRSLHFTGDAGNPVSKKAAYIYL